MSSVCLIQSVDLGNPVGTHQKIASVRGLSITLEKLAGNPVIRVVVNQNGSELFIPMNNVTCFKLEGEE